MTPCSNGGADGCSCCKNGPSATEKSSLDDIPLRENHDSFIDSAGPVAVDGNLRSREVSSGTGIDSEPRLDVRRRSIPVKLKKTQQAGQYLLTADETEIREILKQSIEREETVDSKGKKRPKFKSLVFTRQFTTFDRQNPQSASSQFHGFFTLFWLGVSLMSLRLAANNWRTYGSVWGQNEIILMMLHKDVLVLAITDGVLCCSTIFCLFLQRALKNQYIQWDRSGWIIQNVCLSSLINASKVQDLTTNL